MAGDRRYGVRLLLYSVAAGVTVEMVIFQFGLVAASVIGGVLLTGFSILGAVLFHISTPVPYQRRRAERRAKRRRRARGR